MSETAKFNRNTLVMVRIRRFCTNVIITNEFPTIANNRIVAYNGICKRPLDSQSIHDVVTAGTLCTAIVVTVVVVEMKKLFCVTYFAWCCCVCGGKMDDS